MGLFDKLTGKGAGQAVVPCQAGKGVLLVRVVRSDNGKPVSGATVDIANGATPGNGASNGGGTATFSNRDPGNYTVNVPLVGALANYKIVEQENSGDVAAGGTKILTVKVAPLGHLQVDVVHEKDKSAYLHDVEITVSGSDQASQVLPGGGGHLFGPLAAGKYTVSVTARGKGAWEQRVVNQQNVVVPAGGTGRAQIKLKRLTNVVTPKIETEYKVVLKDRGLSAHQALGEVLLKADDVTRVELSIEQSHPAIGYDGKGQVTVAPANVDVFTDAACTLPLAGKTANNLLLPGPCVLYLKGKTAGRFTLELLLDPPTEPFVEVKGPAREEMGCVELKCTIHQHDLAAIRAMADIEPDVHPYPKYYDALHKAKLPDQVALTDQAKVATGRLLHEQINNHHGRAWLKLELGDASHWPAGSENYIVGLTCDPLASLKFFDKEYKGTEHPADALTVKKLKAKPVELWVEGASASLALRDRVLSMGLDRAAGGLAHTPKLRGDWGRFTVVKVEEVKVHSPDVANTANPWDSAENKFYINFQDDNAAHDGRKITLEAKLTQPLAGINLHFMLAPHKENRHKPNWGIDKPTDWKWKDVDPDLKHIDKPDRKKLLHEAQATDAQGKAQKVLVLSRFGGDIFTPTVYIEQDPFLAKHMPAHEKLKKHHGVQTSHTVQVWRKFWYQRISVATGTAYPAFTTAEGMYAECRATMAEATPAITITNAEALAFNPPGVYPKYMWEVNGGNDQVSMVADANKASFLAVAGKAFAPEADKPLKTPIIICDVNSGDDGEGNVFNDTNWIPVGNFPRRLRAGKVVVKPPVQGGDLVVAGARWQSMEWDGTNETNPDDGDIDDADISIDPARGGLGTYTVALPAGVPATATHVKLTGLKLQAAETGLLGGFDRTDQRTVVVYDSTEPVDFQNTVGHEVGHSLFQARKHQPGIPKDHPKWYWKSGNHCKVQTNRCLMYESGPIKNSLNKYCPTCHPFVLVQNMFRLKANADNANNDA